jgi:hypothetical protein
MFTFFNKRIQNLNKKCILAKSLKKTKNCSLRKFYWVSFFLIMIVTTTVKYGVRSKETEKRKTVCECECECEWVSVCVSVYVWVCVWVSVCVCVWVWVWCPEDISKFSIHSQTKIGARGKSFSPFFLVWKTLRGNQSS